ncbi:putative uncharacterized protein DDB_G0282133 [Oppia nitens]|uniref:putative uncharacterized protein DDB_G0282133 n=1 Tax=Oppia nitens TaxID=1686743 RepID=UPI0023DCD80E|nr:putative uncharacterized protein DDB_G0282133 [Oppia nitens]
MTKMPSRYSKGNNSLKFSSDISGGPSALSLYTNATNNKSTSSASSGYISDHYSSPSSYHSLSGYISDVGSSSQLSKSSYLHSNTYRSTTGVKTYSTYGSSYTSSGSSSSTVPRNLSTNTSRMPSISYSYSNGYARNTSPNPPKYVSYSRSSRSTTHSSHEFNNNNKINEITEKSKAPADFSSDSDSESNETDMITHTNIIVTSRSTSPNREVSHIRVDSISAIQQIIRPKKVMFGVSLKKQSQLTQVKENDFIDRLPESRSPCRSLTPTPMNISRLSPTISPNISPTLSPAVSPTPSVSPSHSPSSTVRMRYGYTPNRKSNNRSNFNRYSMPVMTITTSAMETDYSNFTSISNNTNNSHIERAQSPQTSTSVSNLAQQSLQTMPVIIDQQSNANNNTVNCNCDQKSYENDNNNNNLLVNDSKSIVQRRSANRISPSIIRRRRSQSRGKLSGRSRSRSRDVLDKHESESTLTTSSSSDDEEHRQNNTSERRSRIRKKKNFANIDTNLTNQMQCKNNNEIILNTNIITPVEDQCLGDSCVNTMDDHICNNHCNNFNNKSNQLLTDSDNIIISQTLPNGFKLAANDLMTELYTTASECEDSEFFESDAEKIYPTSVQISTRNTSNSNGNDKTDQALQLSVTYSHIRSQTKDSSESSDNSSKSYDTIRLNDQNIQKSTSDLKVISSNRQRDEGVSEDKCLTYKESCRDKSGDNSSCILSDMTRESVDCLDMNPVSCLPSFPKEDNDIVLQDLNLKEGSLRDSGFSESSNRPDSPYDNIVKPNDAISLQNDYNLNNITTTR